MKLARSTTIHRPPMVVWQFVVIDHLRNHPRWDPDMELRQLTEGPVGMGTRIHRRHARTGTPIEGTMEVVDFDPERELGMLIHDQTPSGPLEVRSRLILHPEGDHGTTMTIHLEILGATASIDPSRVEASLARMKELIEAETRPG